MIQFMCGQWPAKAGWLLLGESMDRGQGITCGAEHDRDVNAAKNLLKRSIEDATQKAIAATDKQTAGGGPVAACGEEGSGRGRKTAVKPASAKQEVNHELAITRAYE